MQTLGEILGGALVQGGTGRSRMQPHMFGGAIPLPPELPPEQWTNTLRALLPDPATQWMNRPPPRPAPLAFPRSHLSTMQKRFGY